MEKSKIKYMKNSKTVTYIGLNYICKLFIEDLIQDELQLQEKKTFKLKFIENNPPTLSFSRKIRNPTYRNTSTISPPRL